MKRLIACCMLLSPCFTAWADAPAHDLQVEVHRDGDRYNFSASFVTSLSPCAAYEFLTDYDAAKKMPGVIDSSYFREDSNHVHVERTASERILFFRVHMHSTMEYTERPYQGVSFVQLKGDSKEYRGDWEIRATPGGSKLSFAGEWEPDTVIPLFIIDHFAKNQLADRFETMARQAETSRTELSAPCSPAQLTASANLMQSR